MFTSPARKLASGPDVRSIVQTLHNAVAAILGGRDVPVRFARTKTGPVDLVRSAEPVSALESQASIVNLSTLP
jgi:hypothetical protein